MSVTAESPDGHLVAFTSQRVGRRGSDVVLVDLKSGTELSRFHREGGQVTSLQFAPDGSSLFEGERSGRITQREMPAGTVRREFVFPNQFFKEKFKPKEKP